MSEPVLALLVAMFGGAAVGVERQWSGHASGPDARFAGVRTFALIGALGGLAGLFWSWGATGASVALLSATGALVVVAYIRASRRDIDATTEVAAIVVLAAGVTAGLGHTAVASGTVAVTALLLFEKSRLHDLVARVEGDELLAAFRFFVMAVVILPLLPEGPFGPLGGVRPRALWLLVLFFSGLSFVGYIARRLVGPNHGYPLAGMLGGMVSSTSVTLSFARLSRDNAALAVPLAQGVVAANTVLFVRVVVAAAVLSPALAVRLAPLVAAPFVIGCVAVVSGLLRERPIEVSPAQVRNPLQLRGALEMALLFQVVLYVVYAVQQRFGEGGLLATAAIIGLNDADALTLSMAAGVGQGRLAPDVAALAVTVGLLSNTLLKGGLAAAIGEGRFRAITIAVLTLMALALGAAAVAG